MKKKIITLASATMMLLAGCANINQATQKNVETESSRSKVVQSTTNQLSNQYYRALITNGRYQVSKTRGATLSLNTGFNLRNFESGLIELSRAVFPTNQYFFREGQVIDSTTTNQWVARKSEKKSRWVKSC